MEVAVDAERWQTVISAFSTPMLCFLSSPMQGGTHFMLCSLPRSTAPHGASTSRKCTHYKRRVSLPKLDSTAVPFQGRTVHWFPLCAFKTGTLTAGLKWQSSIPPARTLRKSLDVSAGAQLYWCLLLQKETPLCLLPSLQRGYWQLHFNQFFCLSYLFHPRERSPMTSPAMPQHVLVTQSLQMGQTKSPFQASFHLRFLQHGPCKIILKWLLHDLWEMWLILEKMLLKLNS